MLWDQVEERIKGFIYAAQPDRLTIENGGNLIFQGNHRPHLIMPTANGWICDCETFWRFLPLGGWCRHMWAAERILTALNSGTAQVCQAETVNVEFVS